MEHRNGILSSTLLRDCMESRTVKPQNQLPNTVLPLMLMIVIIDRLCHIHQDLRELFRYFYDRVGAQFYCWACWARCSIAKNVYYSRYSIFTAILAI